MKASVILRIVFIFTIGSLFTKAYTQIKINEILAINASINYDTKYYNFPGWIELYNPGTASVNIGGYYLSDSKTIKNKWAVPANTYITANGYLLIWCDSKYSQLHTNFDIDADGEGIYLYNNSLAFIDSARFTKQYSNISYGRISNGSSWGYFQTPTPAAANSSSGAIGLLPYPVFSYPSGRYTYTINLTLTSPIPGTQIRYTLDGSEPTPLSTLYSSPISLIETAVIKAKNFTSYGIPSETVTRTYFMGEHEFTLPVFSVSMNPTFLWDNTIGMYTVGTNGISGNCGGTANYNRDWGRYCVVEYFNKEGVSQFKKDFETKIHGGCSRTFFEQKSLAFFARNEFGKGHVEYPFFKSKDIDKFDAFILRNAGNDFNTAHFRDPLMQEIVKDRYDLEWQAYQPAIVYLNGAYWGIMNIREKLNEHYIEHNALVDSDSIDLLEKNSATLNGSNSEYLNFMSKLATMKIWEKATYDYVDANIDLTNFIHYYIAQIYYANKDWPGNNIKYWQPKKSGGKWRWILFDTDLGFALPTFFAVDHLTLNYVTDSTTTVSWPNPKWSTLLFRTLIKNSYFRTRFIQTFQASLNSVFKPSRVIQIIDSISALYATEMPYHKTKWPLPASDWISEVDALRSFAIDRNPIMTNHLRSFFGLTQPLEQIDVTVNPGNAGTILLNQIKFTGKDTFQVFQQLPYMLDATPASGYKFKNWRITKNDGTTVVVSSIKSFTDTAKSNISIIAEFETVNPVTNVYINEIAAKNTTIKDNYGNPDDWFEIYNANADSVDLKGLFITDNFKRKSKFKIQSNGTNNTKIPPLGYTTFWADEEPYQGNKHVSFKLSGSGERLGIFQVVGSDTIALDSVTYKVQIDQTSFIRYPDGFNNWYISTTPTWAATNIKSDLVKANDLVSDKSGLLVYPNPVTNTLNINQPINGNSWFKIYNNLGQPVLSGKLGKNQIEVNKLPGGFYILVITNNSRVIKSSFIKNLD